MTKTRRIIMKPTNEQIQFILANNDKMERREIKKKLGVSVHIATAWCIELCGRKRSANGTKNKHRKPVSKDGFFEHDYSIATI